MITGNVIQITGLYFQLCPANGVQQYHFQGTFFRDCAKKPHIGIMLDCNGLARLSQVADHPEEGVGFLKEYIGDSPRHTHPILYRFNKQFEDKSFWIGRYELEQGRTWGEAHITCSLLDDELYQADHWMNWYATGSREIWRKTRSIIAALPPDFARLSFHPRIPGSMHGETLPPIEEYGSDIYTICEGVVSKHGSLLHAWATIYYRCEIVARRNGWSVKEMLTAMRRMLGRQLQSSDILGLLITELLTSEPPEETSN